MLQGEQPYCSPRYEGDPHGKDVQGRSRRPNREVHSGKGGEPPQGDRRCRNYEKAPQPLRLRHFRAVRLSRAAAQFRFLIPLACASLAPRIRRVFNRRWTISLPFSKPRSSSDPVPIMNHSDPLRDPKSKIKWAKSQILNINSDLQRFVESKPYTTIEEVNAEERFRCLKIVPTREIPDELETSVTQCINAIRSSLDLLIASLVRAKSPGFEKTVKFPFGKSREIFEGEISKKVEKHLPAGAGALIRSLQPYKGGNDGFFALHDLDIAGKHRNLLEVRAFGHSMRLGSLSGQPTYLRIPGSQETPGMLSIFPQIKGGYLEKGIEVLRFSLDGETNLECDATIEVVFGEIDIVARQPVVPLLQQFADFAQSIILTFERRFFPPPPPRVRW